MDREEAHAEAGRRQAAEPSATWKAIERDGSWTVARIGIPRQRPQGTATKPPPEPPREGPPNMQPPGQLGGA